MDATPPAATNTAAVQPSAPSAPPAVASTVAGKQPPLRQIASSELDAELLDFEEDEEAVGGGACGYTDADVEGALLDFEAETAIEE